MATNISHGFNIPKDHEITTTLKRFLTLRKGSKNTFTLNPGDAFLNNMGSMRENSSKTLGRMGKESSEVMPKPLSALEQARCLADGQGGFNSKSSSSAKLEQAKKSFQSGSYKKAKKSFKRVLQSELSHREKKMVELYLVTIYLLLNNKHAVKEYRKAIELLGEVAPYKKGDAIFLTQAIYAHLHRLIQEKEAPESIKGPFLIPQLYERAWCFSEDERVMAKSLHKKFCMSND